MRNEIEQSLWEALTHAEELGLSKDELVLLAWHTGISWTPKKEAGAAIAQHVGLSQLAT